MAPGDEHPRAGYLNKVLDILIFKGYVKNATAKHACLESEIKFRGLD